MKKKVRYLVDQVTNHGIVKIGDEKLVDAEIAEIEVKRGLAEYIIEPTPSYKNWGIPREVEKPTPAKTEEDNKDSIVNELKSDELSDTPPPESMPLESPSTIIESKSASRRRKRRK